MTVFLILLLLYMSVTDIRTRRVPTEMILAGACFFYLYIFILWNREGYAAAREMFTGGAAGAAVMFVITFIAAVLTGMLIRGNALGGGDVRLFSLIGLYLGLTKGLYVIFLTCSFAGAFMFIRMLRKKNRSALSGRRFPLVPFICLSCFTAMMF